MTAGTPGHQYTGTPVHRYTGMAVGRPSDGLVKVVVRTNFCVPLGPRAAGGGPSGTQKLINKNLFEAKTWRKPSENLTKTSRKPGENLAKTSRKVVLRGRSC